MSTAPPSLSGLEKNQEETYVAVLEGLGELRPDWINNPKYMYRTILIYAPLVGALGVLSGYALYFQVEPIVHLRQGATLLFTEISVAVALGAIAEWIRQVIDEGAKRLPSRRTVLSTILTLLLFEIFIASAHSIFDPNQTDTVRAIHDVWAGDARDFVLVALLWTISGAVLMGILARTVFLRRRNVWVDARYGVLCGIGAGAIAAAIVLGYMLVARAVLVGDSIFANHQGWHAILDKHHIASVLGRGVDYAIDARPLGRSFPVAYVVLFLIAAVVSRRSWKTRSLKPIGVLILGVIVVLGLAVVDLTLVTLPIYVWLAWSIPGALLGGMVPWFRARAKLPHTFGVILLLFGVVLIFIGLFHPNPFLGLLPATILAFSGIEILRDREVREFWPAVALSVAIITCFVTPIQANPANFRGVLGNINGLTAAGPIRDTFFGPLAPPTNASGTEAGTRQAQGQSDESKDEQKKDVVLSQLCIIGSFGFWVSLGLLVCWSIRLTQERTKLHADGKMRCFWASEAAGSINYHDSNHGVRPRTDEELFVRLAVALLTYNSPWEEHGDFVRAFEDFVPQKVAQINREEVQKRLRTLRAMGSTQRWHSTEVSAAIENAQRMVNYQDMEEETLSDALQLQAASGPQSAVTFFRSIFKLRRDFPVGSFLQSTGFLPGAHFPGCWRHLGYPDDGKRAE
jgi:DNA-3-methyladenine glycosylase I